MWGENATGNVVSGIGEKNQSDTVCSVHLSDIAVLQPEPSILSNGDTGSTWFP